MTTVRFFYNSFFLLKSLAIFFEYCFFILLRFNSFNCFKYSIKKLGNLNIFYVKIFQSLSTNVNILNEEQVNFLTQYTDNVPYSESDKDISFLETMSTISKKNNIKFTIDNINKKSYLPEPIKSGMIALVYSGKLNNEKIIIKVMRKDIENKLILALEEIEFLINTIKKLPFIKKLNFEMAFRENKKNLLLQTNFINEKKNMQLIRKNFKNIDYIVIPTPYEEYTELNKNIIVMNYLDGNKISDLKKNDKNEYGILFAKFGAKCVLYDGFIHADLHAGNILFIKDNNNKLQLGILDFGVMESLNKDEQNIFYKFFEKFSRIDNYKLLGDNFLDDFTEPKDVIKKLSIYDNNILRAKLGIVSGSIFDKNKNITAKDMYDINSILYSYNLHLSKTFCRIQLSQIIGDSVSANLNNNKSYMENLRIVGNSMFSNDLEKLTI
tara:strand:- start:94 stop:1407 length:1314 start_codon:yes stop_codon:yes gene_type:complete